MAADGGDKPSRRKTDKPGALAWRMDEVECGLGRTEDGMARLAEAVGASITSRLQSRFTIPSEEHYAQHTQIPKLIDWVAAQKELELIRKEAWEMVEEDHRYIQAQREKDRAMAETRMLVHRDIYTWAAKGIITLILSVALTGAAYLALQVVRQNLPP